jgi:hypothetical protein
MRNYSFRSHFNSRHNELLNEHAETISNLSEALFHLNNNILVYELSKFYIRLFIIIFKIINFHLYYLSLNNLKWLMLLIQLKFDIY